jgi:predicted  nucleic acid-binding Zn-ribbon protein
MKKKIVLLIVILLTAVSVMAVENVYLKTKMQRIRIVTEPIRTETAVKVRLDALDVKMQQAKSSFQKAQSDLNELNGAQAALRAELGTISDMSETESLRLQMIMDRLSKLMSTLSNVLKQSADTQKTIIQNMK